MQGGWPLSQLGEGVGDSECSRLPEGRDLRLGDQRCLRSLAACLCRVRAFRIRSLSCAGPAPEMREDLTA